MTADVVASDHVVELGPGTGVFTRALLERGVSPLRMTLVEANPDFAELLSGRFADSRVVCADAASESWPVSADTEIDVVISGLPLLSMPAEAVSGVLSTAFEHLRPEGRFYQFTYGPCCPVRPNLMDTLRLRATLAGRTVRNLPPASVYRIERRRDWQPTR